MKRLRLKPGYLRHYLGFKRGFHRNEKMMPINRVYNSLLHDYLVECQKKSFLPSKEFLTEKCMEFSVNADYISGLNGSALDRVDYVLMDNSIDNMDFLPLLRNKKSVRDSSEYVCLEVIGLIPLKGLTKIEQGLIAGCFNEVINEDEGVVQIILLDVMVSSVITEDRQEQINSYVKRIARQKFKEFAMANGSSTLFRYSVIQKIRDFWLDGGI
jgi:hypothetical protein